MVRAKLKDLDPLECPFCGELPEVKHLDKEAGEWYRVECNNELCPVAPATYRHKYRRNSIRSWNERRDD